LESEKPFALALIEQVLDRCLTFIVKFGKFPMAYSQISVTQTFLRIFKYYLRPFENEEVISAIRKKFPKRFRI